MKLANLPRILRINFEAVKLLENWPEVVRARTRNAARTNRLQFRNGAVLQGEPRLLEWLLLEIWVNRAYSALGYGIQPGDTVIDVGANIGAFTLFAATSAPDVKVYAFEPFASNVALLRKTSRTAA
jgi:hypothetical protein